MISNENLRGAVFMSLAMAGFALNDAAIKLIGAEIGIYQSIFIRGVLVSLMIAAAAQYRGVLRPILGAGEMRRVSLRALADIIATLAFLTALVNMPIANITAILQILPLTVTLGAALFLKEAFGWRRGVAIGIGFLGAVIIIRPGTDGFNVYALLGLVAVVAVTWRDILVRRMHSDTPSLFVVLFTAASIAAVSGVICMIFGLWEPVSIRQLAGLTIAAGFIFVGYFFAVAAMRVGEVAAVTPFRYTIMIWALVLGWMVWGEVPDLWTWVGSTVVVGTGIYTVWREKIA